MSEPKRIQRCRTKGWRMPEATVYVGRPTVWGNPFAAGKILLLTGPKAGTYADRADVVEMFRNITTVTPRTSPDRAKTIRHLRAAIQRDLRGKDLACWCPLDQPCHADVLLEIANDPTREDSP